MNSELKKRFMTGTLLILIILMMFISKTLYLYVILITFVLSFIEFTNMSAKIFKNELKWLKTGLLGVSGPPPGSKFRYESNGMSPGAQSPH